MKIDFNKTLVTYQDIPILLDPEKGEYWTLKFVSLEALMSPSKTTLTVSDILHRQELAKEIWKSVGELEVSPEDVSLIRSLIPERFKESLVISASALGALDSNED